MNALESVISKLEKIASSADQITISVIKEQGDLLANMNREQLINRTDSLGQDMVNYVSKSKAPSAPGGITLKDKGNYHKGIAPVFNGGIKMVSKDSKYPFLSKKYPKALGISPKNKVKLISVSIPIIGSRLLKL